MSEYDDEIRAKCRWIIEQKHITLPIETGVLMGEIFDAFKEIETLKAQLKREQSIINDLVKFKQYEDYKFKSDRYSDYYENPVVFPLVEFENLVRKARETVKDRSSIQLCE